MCIMCKFSKIKMYCSKIIAFLLYYIMHGWFTSLQVSPEMCKLIICSLGLLAKHNSIVFFGQIVCLMSHSWRSFDCTRSRLTGLPLLAPDMGVVLNLSENISPLNVITSNTSALSCAAENEFLDMAIEMKNICAVGMKCFSKFDWSCSVTSKPIVNTDRLYLEYLYF